MLTRSVLASVFAAGILGQSVAAGQIVGTPVVAPRPNASFGGNLGSAIASLPLFIFGGGIGGNGFIPGGGGIFPGTGIGAGNALGNGGYGYLGFGNSFRGNYMNQYLGTGGYGYGYGYGYYPNPYVYPQQAPPGTYENPNPVKPVTDLPPTLVAPETPKTGDWADARTSFASASSRVSAARRAVEELRARLEAMGQSPRANLETNTATAEAILRSAQDAMTAGDLDRSLTEIRRASDLAGVVLKEFGR